MNKIEFLSKSLPTKKTPGPDTLLINSTEHLGKKKLLILHKILQKIKKEGILSNLLYKINIILRTYKKNTLKEKKSANQYLHEQRHKNP